jgi:hypothetical protein
MRDRIARIAGTRPTRSSANVLAACTHSWSGTSTALGTWPDAAGTLRLPMLAFAGRGRVFPIWVKRLGTIWPAPSPTAHGELKCVIQILRVPEGFWIYSPAKRRLEHAVACRPKPRPAWRRRPVMPLRVRLGDLVHAKQELWPRPLGREARSLLPAAISGPHGQSGESGGASLAASTPVLPGPLLPAKGVLIRRSVRRSLAVRSVRRCMR